MTSKVTLEILSRKSDNGMIIPFSFAPVIFYVFISRYIFSLSIFSSTVRNIIWFLFIAH